MLQGENKRDHSRGTRHTTCYQHHAVAAFPVQLVPGYDRKAEEHGHQAPEESGLHRWYVADLFDAYIHQGEEECSSQHVQNTLIDFHAFMIVQ
jgi:hypothetical protein